MKSISCFTRLFQLVGAYLLLASLQAGSDIHVLVKYGVFRLPQPAVEALQARKPSDEDLYAAIQQFVKAGSAAADKMILIYTKLGHRAESQQIQEWLYQDPSSDSDDARFLDEPLGEALEIHAEELTDDGSLILKVQSHSTQLGPKQAGQPTFLRAELSTPLRATSARPSFLGQLQSQPGDGSSSVALAFITPTVRPFLAENSKARLSQRFRAQFEVISLPQSTAAMLVSATPDHTELYGKLHNLISAKTAKLEIIQLLHVKLSQRGKVEHIDEFPYPTNFSHGRTPEQVTITDPGLRALLMEPSIGKHPLPPPNAGSSLVVPPAPFTFSVRNLGDTLDLDSFGHSDGSISVTISAAKVRVLSVQRQDGFDQPSFGLQALKTEVRMYSNAPLLIGTMNRPVKTGDPASAPEDRVWLAFLTLRE